jgi:hypothetical protein
MVKWIHSMLRNKLTKHNFGLVVVRRFSLYGTVPSVVLPVSYLLADEIRRKLERRGIYAQSYTNDIHCYDK